MVLVCTPCPAHLSLQQNVLKVTEQEDGRGGVYTQDCEERGMRAGLGQTSSSGGPGDWSEGAPVLASKSPQGGAGMWCVLAQPLQEGVKENKETSCSCESAW